MNQLRLGGGPSEEECFQRFRAIKLEVDGHFTTAKRATWSFTAPACQIREGVEKRPNSVSLSTNVAHFFALLLPSES